MKSKRIYMFFLGGIVMCLLSSCASSEENKNSVIDGSLVQGQDYEGQKPEGSTEPPKASEEPSQPISEENGNQQITAPNDEGENLVLSPEESYKAILLGKKDFINSSRDGEYLDMVNIGDIWKAVTVSETSAAKVSQFAIVDMDGDGENEIVLWIKMSVIDEGFEVLRYQDGKVYGYHFWYRALDSLKEDGTYEGSGSSSDRVIGRMTFLEKGYTEKALYQSDSQYGTDGVKTMQYYANGEICSEEEFNEALSRQNEKADVVWYELTPENVELAFENRF